jgi:hypothetical protein
MPKDEESAMSIQNASLKSLDSNMQARIRNPLAGIPREQLLRDVEAFAQNKGLTNELLVLRRGAICEMSKLIIVDCF